MEAVAPWRHVQSERRHSLCGETEMMMRGPVSTCADKGATFAQWRETLLCVPLRGRPFFFSAREVQGSCQRQWRPDFVGITGMALEDAADNSGPRYPDGSAS